MSDTNEPGIRGHDAVKPELTLEAKAAVRRYLVQIFFLIGLVNVAVIGGVVLYLFVKVPPEVAIQTKALVQNDLSTLTTTFMNSSVEALRKAVAAQVQAEAVVERGKGVDVVLADLQKKIDAVSGGDKGGRLVQLSEHLKEVEATIERSKHVDAKLGELEAKINRALSGDTIRLLESLKGVDFKQSGGGSQISAIVGKMDADFRAFKERFSAENKPSIHGGFGVGIHKHEVVDSRCPPGMVAVGLQVTYGGTCKARCDEDGGVIQEIKLYCQ